MKLRLSERARRDRREFEAYYAEYSQTVVARFRSELSAALRYIGDYPRGAPVRSGAIRSRQFHSYPHSVLYFVAENELHVLAITHHKRNPETYDDLG